MPLRSWSVDCPPKEMTDLYEVEKFKFTNALNQKITQELEMMSHANDVPKIDIKNELNQESCQPALWEYCSKNGYVGQVQLAKDFGIYMGKPNGMSLGQLNLNILSMRKKGWDIRKFKKN